MYYKVCNLLIKSTAELNKFKNISEVVVIGTEEVKICIKVVIPGLNRVLAIILDKDIGLSTNLIFLDEKVPSSITLEDTYTL